MLGYSRAERNKKRKRVITVGRAFSEAKEPRPYRVREGEERGQGEDGTVTRG